MSSYTLFILKECLFIIFVCYDSKKKFTIQRMRLSNKLLFFRTVEITTSMIFFFLLIISHYSLRYNTFSVDIWFRIYSATQVQLGKIKFNPWPRVTYGACGWQQWELLFQRRKIILHSLARGFGFPCSRSAYLKKQFYELKDTVELVGDMVKSTWISLKRTT